ncbi:MAG: 2-amino-4-hydroxy-6-hydroxymethyldihydropteridine diphosphokinase [Chitinophagaceae bacterium]
MNLAYLLIGGNLGDRICNLGIAKSLIEKQLGDIVSVSSIYETAPWGINEQPDFFNQVLLIKTKLSPDKIMRSILSIEKKMGRVRSQKNASRIIDIDILFFNDEVIKLKNLTIPHPEIQNRKFVLIPLHEIAPDIIHPVFKQSIKNLLQASKDKLEVKPLSR